MAGLVEERGIEAVFHNNPAACAILSFIVRTGNTFLGSLLWVSSACLPASGARAEVLFARRITARQRLHAHN